jgi:putative transcription factor
MNCDLCGRETEFLLKTEVEGTELNLCKECSQHGKVLRKIEAAVEKPKSASKPTFTLPEREIIQVIIPDYANLIKEKREQLGLKQEEFAKKIAEKESIIHKIETGQFEPSIALARKVEKFLKIKLIEEHEETKQKTKKSSEDEGFTIGDIIKIKK